MKNKLFTLLTVTMLTCAMLIGCGGSETTDNTANAGTENNATVDSEETSSLATIQPDVEYIEREYYFGVPGEEYLDDTYADGETLDVSEWENVNQIVTIKESINMFDPNKQIMGYLKPGIECIYMSTNGEWSRIYFGTDMSIPTGSVFVRTEDLEAVTDIVIPDSESGAAVQVNAEEYYNKVKTALEGVGFTYDESVFEGVDKASIPPTVWENEHYMFVCTTIKFSEFDKTLQAFVDYNSDCGATHFMIDESEIVESEDGPESAYYFKVYFYK